jgi:mannose-6-phosphate isomerase
MARIYRLENRIQTYAWGSHTAIAELLGLPMPSPEPQAELWMGAHPRAPSEVDIDGRRVSLDRLIKTDPLAMLGPEAMDKFGNRLPYLFKVLAAAEPLSIQAHPSRSQAIDGYGRENRLGIPLDAPQRNYRDDNHKPECLCALTRFWGMCGFRFPAQILDGLAGFCPNTLAGERERFLKAPDARGTRALFTALMTLPEAKKEAVLKEAACSALRLADGKSRRARWIARLVKAYPADIGVISPLLLNLVCLEPGEAMFLPAGQLHAYLEGTGMELMANSDNVLRGGLTPKHVDVAELTRTLNFDPIAIQPLCPEPVSQSEKAFPGEADEFCLSVVRVGGPIGDYRSPEKRSMDILLCTRGAGRVGWGLAGHGMAFEKGACLMAPAVAGRYQITGDADLYKAAVPLG